MSDKSKLNVNAGSFVPSGSGSTAGSAGLDLAQSGMAVQSIPMSSAGPAPDLMHQPSNSQQHHGHHPPYQRGLRQIPPPIVSAQPSFIPQLSSTSAPSVPYRTFSAAVGLPDHINTTLLSRIDSITCPGTAPPAGTPALVDCRFHSLTKLGITSPPLMPVAPRPPTTRMGISTFPASTDPYNAGNVSGNAVFGCVCREVYRAVNASTGVTRALMRIINPQPVTCVMENVATVSSLWCAPDPSALPPDTPVVGGIELPHVLPLLSITLSQDFHNNADVEGTSGAAMDSSSKPVDVLCEYPFVPGAMTAERLILDSASSGRPPPSAQWLWGVGAQLCVALHASRQAGVPLRCITAANVLLQPSTVGSPRVFVVGAGVADVLRPGFAAALPASLEAFAADARDAGHVLLALAAGPSATLFTLRSRCASAAAQGSHQGQQQLNDVVDLISQLMHHGTAPPLHSRAVAAALAQQNVELSLANSHLEAQLASSADTSLILKSLLKLMYLSHRPPPGARSGGRSESPDAQLVRLLLGELFAQRSDAGPGDEAADVEARPINVGEALDRLRRLELGTDDRLVLDGSRTMRDTRSTGPGSLLVVTYEELRRAVLSEFVQVVARSGVAPPAAATDGGVTM